MMMMAKRVFFVAAAALVSDVAAMKFLGCCKSKSKVDEPVEKKGDESGTEATSATAGSDGSTEEVSVEVVPVDQPAESAGGTAAATQEAVLLDTVEEEDQAEPVVTTEQVTENSDACTSCTVM